MQSLPRPDTLASVSREYVCQCQRQRERQGRRKQVQRKINAINGYACQLRCPCFCHQLAEWVRGTDCTRKHQGSGRGGISCLRFSKLFTVSGIPRCKMSHGTVRTVSDSEM